jgi:peptide/nickel transport system ATP-binding protein
MYAGTIVELGPTDEIIHAPQHPYTQGLLGALPQKAGGNRRLNQIQGVMPGLAKIPPGCPFSDRCALVEDICRRTRPTLDVKANGNQTACHLVD